LPNVCVVRVRSPHASGSTGAFQRSAPTGAFANGIPFQEYVPDAAESSLPLTMPRSVFRRVGDRLLVAAARTQRDALSERQAATVKAIGK